MLRLDWNILFNMINILILYVLVKRFLFRPINEILEKRRKEADSRFALAKEQEAQAQVSREKYTALLQDAEGEKERIVAKARQEASDEYGRILEEARERADGIVEKARQDACREKEVLLQQADGEIKDMILTAAAKIAGTKRDGQNDSALYDAFLHAEK